MQNVAVFGMGYVGCVTAACLSRDGHRVFGVDVDLEKVKAIQSGRPTVLEPGLEELVADGVRGGRLSATDDLAEAVDQSSMALIAVGTPSREDGGVCTDAVVRVAREIGERLRQTGADYRVCLRSTLLPGLLENVIQPELDWAAGRPVTLCNNPEFLREGSAISDYDAPPFIVVGANDEVGAEAVLDLYDNLPAQVERIVTDTRTAAMVKYASNAFHALKVSFANEIGTLCGQLQADGPQVMEIVCKDRKLNISPAYLRPGLAFGGSCLPKDVRALVRCASEAATTTPLLPAILSSNEAHLARAIRQVQRAGHQKIGIVGLGFKAGTDDLRESPLVVLCEALLGKGANLRIYDPHVSVSRLRGRNRAYVEQHLPHLAGLLVEEAADLFEHATLLVLSTDVADNLDIANGFPGEVIDLRGDLAASAEVGQTLSPIGQ